MLRTIRFLFFSSLLISLLTLLNIQFLMALGPSLSNSEEGTVLPALDRFRVIRRGDCREFFRSIRPPSMTAEMKSQALTLLPSKGDVNPDARSVSMLEKLWPVFAYHERNSGMEIKLIKVPPAAVALYARCVLIISEQTLRFLTVDELRALVAHELGHDYVWEEYESAVERHASQSIQQLELWCDGVAILTLLDLGIDPRSLVSAVGKINRYNSRFGSPQNVGDYPSDRMRATFLNHLLDMTVRMTIESSTQLKQDSRTGSWVSP